ncbi:hypothetical protein Nepgr_006799 [Nepenthes gracilis]|uniref:Secreted protein n=1 Tax=Nepenthes gracilis TaxID=150966 RepID=A0AAD3S611_NEPGR|nr:hypothetical protein Nepgr_006799 [Nepenthes gracilis]
MLWPPAVEQDCPVFCAIVHLLLGCWWRCSCNTNAGKNRCFLAAECSGCERCCLLAAIARSILLCVMAHDLNYSVGMRISVAAWKSGFEKLIRLDCRLAGGWFGFAD